MRSTCASPSDYIIERMIAKDLLAEISYDNVPNFEQIIDKLRNPDYDPENKYSVPYMWEQSASCTTRT